MKYQLDILRRKSADASPYWLHVSFETEDEGATVATALTRINGDPSRCDIDGSPFDEIRWECSCLQKKCGACAMVICGRPALACDSFLKDAPAGKPITIEPLRKFPVIADLIVDRSVLYSHLDTLGVWTDAQEGIREKYVDLAYEASRCLQCGCCVEICPNCWLEGSFYGAASFVPNARIATLSRDKTRKKTYAKHVFNGCGKSLACHDICPAGIEIDKLLSRSNRLMIWKG